ncbi:MAG: sigma-70 family RNA polymerase sigma factor [Lentisphaeraceae bacterium]|nr:sigma-70 family RNA polymerase sigma factor [Lentisphaeraceae bacterium]
MDKSTEIFLKITENRSRIMATIVAMVRDFNVSEDIFQETVLEVVKSSGNFDSTRDFAPWACAIARNVVRRHWRNQEKQPIAIEQDALNFLAEIAVENSEPGSWQDDQQALQLCLKKLPKPMQNLITLRYGYNCKGPELAEKASIKPGAIRTTLLRLRQKLRICIKSKRDQDFEYGVLE